MAEADAMCMCTGTQVRVLKQRIWVEGESYEPQEIYGIDQVITVALWNPSHRSRVNSGSRFNRGFDRRAPIECRQKAAWWASVWVIWAVAWFGIDPFETANSAVR